MFHGKKQINGIEDWNRLDVTWVKKRYSVKEKSRKKRVCVCESSRSVHWYYKASFSSSPTGKFLNLSYSEAHSNCLPTVFSLTSFNVLRIIWLQETETIWINLLKKGICQTEGVWSPAQRSGNQKIFRQLTSQFFSGKPWHGSCVSVTL